LTGIAGISYPAGATAYAVGFGIFAALLWLLTIGLPKHDD
jgi:hypothetical protein